MAGIASFRIVISPSLLCKILIPGRTVKIVVYLVAKGKPNRTSGDGLCDIIECCHAHTQDMLHGRAGRRAAGKALLAMLALGNYRSRTVPYFMAAVEGDGFNCALYEKEKHGRRKLCVQGGKAQDFVEFFLEPNVLGVATVGYEDVLDPERVAPHGGSDESGKGDYFGPLVVACCYTDETLSEKMREMGVKDCKQMSDKSVLATGAKLRALLGPTGYAVVKLGPAAYNRLYAKIRNINRLLAWAHGTCIEELLEKQQACPKVVVDQFAPTEAVIRRALKERGKKAKVEQRHKAESDIAVAAASVIARELFLRPSRT